jgi:hypothetical protein
LKKIFKGLKNNIKKIPYIVLLNIYIKGIFKFKNINNFNFIKYLRYCFKSKNGIFCTSLPSSGWHYLSDVISCYHLKEKNLFIENFPNKNLDGENDYHWTSREKNISLSYHADIRGSLSPNLKKMYGIPFELFLHTHNTYEDHPFVLNGKIDNMKMIWLIRNPLANIYSFFKKRNRQRIFQRLEENKTINDFIRDTNYLELFCEFFNSWSKISSKNKIKIIKYEDLRTKPEEKFTELINFVNDNQNKINKNTLAYAIDYYDFEKQKERSYNFNSDEKTHFFHRGYTNYDDKFNSSEKKIIKCYFQENLNLDSKKLLTNLYDVNF